MKLLDPDRMAAQDRNLFCDHYVSCLDEAISKNWVSWTCAACILAETGSKLRMVESVAAPT